MLNSLNIAVRALQAHQRAIEITSHNIANANTPGYSRQRVVLTESTPFNQPTMNRASGPGQVGTGVQITMIQRFQSEYLNNEIRGESSLLSHQQVASDTLKQIQVIMQEPSDVGLNNALSVFWSGLNDLSADPSNPAARTTVQQNGAQLTNLFNSTASQLSTLRSSLNTRVSADVSEVNDLASRIAALNVNIENVQALGNQPNDLRDQRDMLLDQLSGLAKISYQENGNGGVTVTLGSHLLIMDGTTQKLAATPNGANNNMGDVTWVSGGSKVALGEGELAGLIDARDTIIPGQLSQLDQLASNISTQVNAIHRAGFGLNGSTNNDFFSGTTAATIGLSAAVQADPANIAAASVAGAAGDGANALAMAQLRTANTMNAGTTTFANFFNAGITQLGLQTQHAGQAVDNHTMLLGNLTSRKQEQTSVSTDEESVELIKSQRAYQAAARCITAVDEMLDKLINGTGTVGR